MNTVAEAKYIEPSILSKLWWRIKQAFAKKQESNLLWHARRELLASGYPPYDKNIDDPDMWIQANVLELIKVFSEQGHSGFSASYCIDYFTKLAKYEPLVPLSGNDDEWIDQGYCSGEPLWQNNRCSHVFKGADGRAYDIDGKVFREPNGACYTSKDSRVYIEFPYTPKTEYIDVAEPTNV